MGASRAVTYSEYSVAKLSSSGDELPSASCPDEKENLGGRGGKGLSLPGKGRGLSTESVRLMPTSLSDCGDVRFIVFHQQKQYLEESYVVTDVSKM